MSTEEIVKEKEQGFTQEKLDAIGQGKVKITDLNATERRQLMEYQRTGKFEDVPEVDAVDKKALTTTHTETPAPVKSVELKAIKEKYFEKGVEANRNKQLLEKVEKDNTFLQEQLDVFKNAGVTKATDDYFDDDSQKNLRETVDLLRGQMTALLEHNKSNAVANQEAGIQIQQDLENQKGSLSIQQLQNNFPDLQTSKPMGQLDNELKSFSEAVGGMDNVNKYLEDPEYKKQMDGQGIAPLSDSFMENLTKYSAIVDLNREYAVLKDDAGQSYKDRNPDVSIENFYMNQLQTTGKFNDMLSNAKLTGANSVADKVVSQKYTAATMTPSGGGDIPESGMTEAKIIEIQARIGPKIRTGIKLSADEQKQYLEVKEYMKQQYTR